MTDISDVLPKESETVKRIFAIYKKEGDAEPNRGYIGASIIGHSCDRFLWYTFRQCVPRRFSGRMYRLFETGDLEEARFVSNLRAIGCEVHDRDGKGEQFEVTDLGGHFSGHMDGCGLGIPEAPKTWHVLEFKTHNAKSFAKLKKEGVQPAKPMHYAQMQAYMHKTGMTRALYLARNKDDDDLYAERIHYDKKYAESLIERARRIITSTEPPRRISDRPDYWECKMCDVRELCHHDGRSKALCVPSLSCRHCCYATPDIDATGARWTCDKRGKALCVAEQDRACDECLPLPGLFSFATPSEFKDDTVTMTLNRECDDERSFKYGKNGFSAKELLVIPASDLHNGTLEAGRVLFDCEVESAGNILSRYPESESRLVWKGPSYGAKSAWKLSFGVECDDEVIVSQEETIEYRAMEFASGRVVIFWEKEKQVEFREGVE